MNDDKNAANPQPKDAPKPPPGWYSEGEGERLWDGEAWTELTRTKQVTEPSTQPTPHRGDVFVEGAVIEGGEARTGRETTPEADDQLREDSSGEVVSATAPPGPRVKNVGKVVDRVIVAIVAVVVLIIVGIGLTGMIGSSSRGADSSKASSTDDDAYTPPPAPEPPAGFDYMTSSGVAWSWYSGTDRSAYCRGMNCTVVYLQATEGCNSLYIEANTLDASGTVVGYTNGTTGALQPGDEAKVALIITDPTATKTKITEINCR